MRVLVIDQQPLIRDAVASLLRRSQPAILVEEEESIANALAPPGDCDLALIICDVLAAVDPVAALRRLRANYPDTTILVLSDTDDQNDVSQFLQAGATAFVRKSDSVETVYGAVQLCLGGGAFVSVNREFRSATHAGLSQDGERFTGPRLTARQREVLKAISRGLSNRDIAAELGVAEGTVKIHVAAIFKALGVSSRTQAVLAAARAGLAPNIS